MNTRERASYLKGLAEGLGLDDSTPERKLIKALIETMGELAEDLDDIRSDISDLDEALADVNDDIADLSDQIDELYDDEDFDDSDDSDACCGCAHGEEDTEPLELDCPACGESIKIDEEMFSKGRFECPHCGEVLELDMGDSDDECDCCDN